jgi:hypothetical protein
MAEIGGNSVGGRGNLAVISRSWQFSVISSQSQLVCWKSRGFGEFCAKYHVQSTKYEAGKKMQEARNEKRKPRKIGYKVYSTKNQDLKKDTSFKT